MAPLDFKSSDFLLLAWFSLLPNLKYTSTFMKVHLVNNKITLFLLMQKLFRSTRPNIYESY